MNINFYSEYKDRTCLSYKKSRQMGLRFKKNNIETESNTKEMEDQKVIMIKLQKSKTEAL